jgi:protein dithiol:quinone oxidoreductase
MPMVAVLSFAAVLIGLLSQHVFDMQPCAWCVLQRLIYIVIGLLALLAWWRNSKVKSTGGLRSEPRLNQLAVLCSVFSLAGVAAALYQHFVAARTDSCAVTLADKIVKWPGLDTLAPWLFKASALCSEANVELLKLPYAIWSALFFLLLLFLSLRGSWRAAR